MNIWCILCLFIIISIGSLFTIRFLFRMYNKKDTGNFNIIGSLLMLLFHLFIWLVLVLIYMESTNDNRNLLWYIIISYSGIAATTWCHFHWDLRKHAKPKFERDKSIIAVKKVFVFTLVMFFSFYYGCQQMNALLMNEKVDAALTIYNVTIISGIISLDRVLNQIPVILERGAIQARKAK